MDDLTLLLQVESVVTAIVDLFPDYLRVGRRREMLVGALCLVDMALGCTMVMQVRRLWGLTLRTYTR